MATPATNPAPANSNNSDSTTDEDLNFNKDAIFDPTTVDTDAPATKRPCGRPPGFKNKPKPPSFVTVGPSDAFRSHIMEIAAGAVDAASLAAYACAHQSGCRRPPRHRFRQGTQRLPRLVGLAKALEMMLRLTWVPGIHNIKIF